MIFYGDTVEDVGPQECLAGIAGSLDEACAASLPIDRHAAMVSALIGSGQLAQGLADLASDERPRAATIAPASDAAMRLTTRLGRAVLLSWRRGFEAAADDVLARTASSIEEIAGLGLPERIRIKPPEGFAHYAVYPEAYVMAAARSRLPPTTRVVGIRSIGTTLAAVTAAALGAATPLTVRPVGHPFRREIGGSPDLDAATRGCGDAPWAVVDEGPGLSGSSFAAVAAALERRGIGRDRITFLPSHAGLPGPESGKEIRRWWADVRRVAADTDAVLFAPPPGAVAIQRWVADITGAPCAPVEDLSAGRWRRARYGDAAASSPPVDPQNERRKILVHGCRTSVLMKFAGLGAAGRATLSRARLLGAGGYTLAPLALRHGFLVERWRDDLAPLRLEALDRTRFLAHLARYIGYRAKAMPAGPAAGAPLDALLAMAAVNAGEALGSAAAERVQAWRSALPGLAAGMRRVAVDGRLHRWEWLEDERGTWIKTDAVDHCAGHDLVGCQDATWDTAGATTEFALSDVEERELLDEVGQAAAAPLRRDLHALFRCLYPAFWLGAASLAAGRAEGTDRDLWSAEVERYRAALEVALCAPRPATNWH